MCIVVLTLTCLVIRTAALGNLGGNSEKFFAEAARSRALFATLFDGLPTQPVDLMYQVLSILAGGRKRVRTAIERGQGGREYCPVIYRSHMPEYGYAPHIDSVRHRERRTDYPDVHRFETQLGGILLLHNPEREPLVRKRFSVLSARQTDSSLTSC
jgi:hypothetical protein